MNWFIGKIKYFFWSTMFSAALLMITANTPQGREKMNALMVLLKMRKAPEVQATLPPPPVETPVSVNVEDIRPSQNAPPVASESSQTKQVSASKNEYIIDDSNYVMINGKYYRARADNTYDIGGQKIYYVNNRRTRQEMNSAESQANRKSVEPEVARQMAQQNPQDGVTKDSWRDNIKLGERPQTPGEMLEIIRKSQEAVDKRNKYLEELGK